MNKGILIGVFLVVIVLLGVMFVVPKSAKQGIPIINSLPNFQGVLLESFTGVTSDIYQYYGSAQYTVTYYDSKGNPVSTDRSLSPLTSVSTNNVQIGDYLIQMERTNRYYVPVGCKGNVCNGVYSNADNYGCPLYQAYTSAGYYCTSSECYCYRTNAQGFPTSPREYAFRVGNGGYIGLDNPLGNTNACGGSAEYRASQPYTCGGVILSEPIRACGFTYKIYKNDQLVAQRNNFDSATDTYSTQDIDIQLGTGNHFQDQQCYWIQNIYRIKIPNDAFSFNLTSTKRTFIQGEPAILSMKVTNRWIDSVIDINLKVCQQTFSGQFCADLGQGNVTSNKNSITEINFSIPTNFVVDRLEATPSLFLKVNPQIHKITNVNMYCEGSIKNVASCRFVPVGEYQGDPQTVSIEYSEAETIRQLSSSLEERKALISALNTSLQEKAFLIDSLKASLEEKSSLLNSLQLSLTEKAALINSLQLSLTEKEQLIGSLKSSITEKAHLIDALNASLQEKASLIDSLDLSLQEKNSLIVSLNASLQEKAGLINSLKISLEQKADLVDALNLSLTEKRSLIDALQLSLEEKMLLISKINSTSSEQRILVDALSASLSEKEKLIFSLSTSLQEKAVLINSLQKSNEEKVALVNSLEISLKEKASLINSLQLSLDEKASLINSLQLSLSEKNKLINALSASLSEKTQLVQALNTSLSEKASLIDALELSTAEKQSLINSLRLSLDEKKKLIESLNISLQEKQQLVQALQASSEEKIQLIDQFQPQKKPVGLIEFVQQNWIWILIFVMIAILLIVILYIKNR